MMSQELINPNNKENKNLLPNYQHPILLNKTTIVKKEGEVNEWETI